MSESQRPDHRQSAGPFEVAFIGLGVMGAPMARHLERGGHRLRVFNRNPARATEWLRDAGSDARSAATPAEAASGADFVFVCVGDDPDLRAVALGAEGALPAMRAGSVLVDHTTASADIARELAAAGAERGVGVLDAPVSGGEQGAKSGQLTVMVGGGEADFERARPLLDCYAKRVRLLGPSGSGQLTKMVNQICIAGLIQALSEGLHFARAAGLDPESVVDVISQGAAQSWQMDARHQTMLAGEYEHGFAVEWMRKDLRIAMAEARASGAQLPVTALVDQFYGDVEGMGGRRWDTSSLLARLEGKR